MIPPKLIAEINRWISEKRYGNLQINFAAGKIVNVNRAESIKVEMLASNDNGTSITVSSHSFSQLPIDQ